MRFIKKSLVAFAMSTGFSGCDLDPFGRSTQGMGGNGMNSHGGKKSLNLDKVPSHENSKPKVSDEEFIAELKSRAVTLAKSAKTYAEVQAGIEALRQEAIKFKAIPGFPGDPGWRFDDVQQVLHLAKSYTLESNDDVAVIPALDFSEEQWTVAAELGKILNDPRPFINLIIPNRTADNCPPKSVNIGDKVVRFNGYGHLSFLRSDDDQFRWSREVVQSKDDRIEALFANRAELANFVQRVPLSSVSPISKDCAAVSKFEKSNIETCDLRGMNILGGFIDLSDPRNAIRVGINALKAFEAIHSVGLVYRSATMVDDIKLRMNGKVPAWDQPDVLALGNLGRGALFVNPQGSVQLSSCMRCKRDDPLYRLSPGEIKGYCSTRADDLYRLSEALFQSCKSFINQNMEKIAAEWMNIKREWSLRKETLGDYYKESNEKYYKVLNEFHDAMFVLSDKRSMEKPDYKG